jgi:hypothetical protein
VSEPQREPELDRRQREAAEELEASKKVVAKVLWAMVAAVLVAIVVFWFGWVRAPSPEAICQHKVNLVFATVGEDQRDGAEALVSQLEIKCVEGARKKILMRGKLVYADYAKCVMAATTLDEYEHC